jgi:hypothetical protein
MSVFRAEFCKQREGDRYHGLGPSKAWEEGSFDRKYFWGPFRTKVDASAIQEDNAIAFSKIFGFQRSRIKLEDFTTYDRRVGEDQRLLQRRPTSDELQHLHVCNRGMG